MNCFFSGGGGGVGNGHRSKHDNSGGHNKGEHRSKGPSATAAETGMHSKLHKCMPFFYFILASYIHVTDYFLPCAEKNCPICLDGFKYPTRTKCGHQFCSSCLSKAMQYEPYCPTCKHVLRPIVGKQPQGGQMTQKVWETMQ